MKRLNKKNLGGADRTSQTLDAMFYMIIAGFYPIFIGLAVFAAMLSGWHPMKTIVLMTILYVLVVGTISFLRNKVVDSAYDLYSPRKIHGTKREDYSVLSSMMIQGRYEEAEQEGMNRFVQDRSADIPQITGDLYMRNKRYTDALRWYQKGVVIAKGAQQLYFLERLVEITDLHLPDQPKLTMYLQKIKRDYTGTEPGQHATRRLRELGQG